MNVPITPGVTGSIGAKLVGPAVISGIYSASVEIVGYARTWTCWVYHSCGVSRWLIKSMSRILIQMKTSFWRFCNCDLWKNLR